MNHFSENSNCRSNLKGTSATFPERYNSIYRRSTVQKTNAFGFRDVEFMAWKKVFFALEDKQRRNEESRFLRIVASLEGAELDLCSAETFEHEFESKRLAFAWHSLGVRLAFSLSLARLQSAKGQPVARLIISRCSDLALRRELVQFPFNSFFTFTFFSFLSLPNQEISGFKQRLCEQEMNLLSFEEVEQKKEKLKERIKIFPIQLEHRTLFQMILWV